MLHRSRVVNGTHRSRSWDCLRWRCSCRWRCPCREESWRESHPGHYPRLSTGTAAQGRGVQKGRWEHHDHLLLLHQEPVRGQRDQGGFTRMWCLPYLPFLQCLENILKMNTFSYKITLGVCRFYLSKKVNDLFLWCLFCAQTTVHTSGGAVGAAELYGLGTHSGTLGTHSGTRGWKTI